MKAISRAWRAPKPPSWAWAPSAPATIGQFETQSTSEMVPAWKVRSTSVIIATALNDAVTIRVPERDSPPRTSHMDATGAMSENQAMAPASSPKRYGP